ncbi:MAG: TPR end-of-group domain-containing protein [Bacteroidia bacterium]
MKRIIFLLLAVYFLTGCRPEGFINKVKYQEIKYVNTCQTFADEVEKTIKSNNTLGVKLSVSRNDNSEFRHYFLEPGQYEIRKDTLCFRLHKDLPYSHYLDDKGTQIWVNVSYRAAGEVADLEVDKEGRLFPLVIDKSYYFSHCTPFFYYKVPLNGSKIDGKELSISFTIKRIHPKKGKETLFCNSGADPFGMISATCCGAQNWDSTKLQSVIEIPKIEAKSESYRKFNNFTATVDVDFPENMFRISDSAFFNAIQRHIVEYEKQNFRPTQITIQGYSSLNGPEFKNIELSQKRADTLKKILLLENPVLRNIPIITKGMGEEWARAVELTGKSKLSNAEKSQILSIMAMRENNDTKEAFLRGMSCWNVFKQEVLSYTRHVSALIDFTYMGSDKPLLKYDGTHQIGNEEITKVITEKVNVKPYDEKEMTSTYQTELRKVNELLTMRPSANLYSLLASYYSPKKDREKYFMALRRAEMLDKNNKIYSEIIRGIEFMDMETMSFEQRKKMLADYNQYVQENPNDRPLFIQRAILMDRVGWISGALNEYNKMWETNTPQPLFFNNRGVARLRTNRFMEAEQDFMSALEQDKTSEKAAATYFNLAIIYAFRGWTSKTMDCLDHAVALDEKYRAMIFTNPAFKIMVQDAKFDKYRPE